MAKKFYHVTQRKHLASIMKNGLVPQVGEVTRAGHGDEATPFVYLLDKPAKGLMFKDFVVLEVKIDDYQMFHYDGNGIENLNGSYDEEGDIPRGIEEGDYFTPDTIDPKDIKLVADKNGKIVRDKKKAVAFLIRSSN